MNRLTASTRLAAAIARMFGLEPSDLAGSGNQGGHGTKALAAARAAACWALHTKLGLSHGAAGGIVGLSTSSARQAIMRAPKCFTPAELDAFTKAAPSFPVQRRQKPAA